MSVLSWENSFGGAVFRSPGFRDDGPPSMARATTSAPGRCVFEHCSVWRMAQILSHLESALMMSSHIREGGYGPGLHYHRSDQLYYLIDGLDEHPAA
jgi:hypothetical protein